MDKFSFFEKVKIIASSSPKTKHLIGRIGVILVKTPIAEDENGEPDFSDVIDYGVRIEGENYWQSFLPDELESTGEIGKREDYYSGASIRVGVDDKGRGFLLDNNTQSDDETD